MRADRPRLVLASGSPRRLELLRQLGLSFEVRPPEIDESLLPDERPEAAAERLGREKALRAAGPGALSLGCDTLVVHGDAILGKPGSPAAAAVMLERLSGQQHVVFTGIALATPDRIESAVEATRVWLRPLSMRECEEYVATGEPLDKAGAYGIQRLGAALVERIDGDYFNVMGLPVRRLLELFERFDLRYAFGELVPLEPAGDEPQPGKGG